MLAVAHIPLYHPVVRSRRRSVAVPGIPPVRVGGKAAMGATKPRAAVFPQSRVEYYLGHTYLTNHSIPELR